MAPRATWRWSTTRQAWYYIDEHGVRRYDYSRTDSANPPGSSSQRSQPSVTSGSPPRGGPQDGMDRLAAALERATLDNQSPFQKRESDFFKPGRVFATDRNYTGAMGSRATAVLEIPADENIARGFRGSGQIYVVIREDTQESPNYCYCLQVNTYDRLGVAKEGVVKSDHGIIFSGRREVEPDKDENPVRGEEGMCAVALRVAMRLPSEKLDPMSRIDYKTRHRFPKWLPVHNLGNVHKDYMVWLAGQYDNVQKRYSGSKNSMSNDDSEDEDEDEDESGSEGDGSNANSNAAESSLSREAQTRAAQAVNEARQAKDAFRRLISQGYTSAQALPLITQIIQRGHPTWTPEQARQGALSRLRSSPNPVQI